MNSVDNDGQMQVGGRDIGPTLKDRIRTYVRHLPYFAVSIAIAFVISFLYLRYTTPVYTVTASLLIKDDNNFSGPNEKFSEMMFFPEKSNLSNEIEILRSQALMERVVRSLNIQTSYYAIGKIKTANIYRDNPFVLVCVSRKDSLFPFSFKVKVLSESSFTVNESQNNIAFNQPFSSKNGVFRLVKMEPFFRNRTSNEFLVTWAPVSQSATEILGSLKIRPVNVSADVLYLSLTTDNTRLGEEIVNRLMAEYNLATIEDKNQIALSTYNFIDNRLKLLSGELGDVEANLANYKRINQIFNLDGQSGLFVDKITEIERASNENAVKLQVANLVKQYVQDEKNVYRLVPSSLGIEDPTLLTLVSEFNKLIVEREKKLRETGPENFIVNDLETKIASARVSIIESLRNVIKSYDLVGEQLKAQRRSLSGEVERVPAKEKQLRDISRQQGIKENLYLYLLQKREETAIKLASTISNSRVVDFAKSSKIPVSPNHTNIYLIAILLGTLVPFLIIYLIDLLNDKVQSVDDIARFTETPMIGTIGHATSAGFLLVTKTSRKLIAEQFRIIRTNLQYFLKQSEKPVILITSSFSGEGKSFVSTNLGAVIALSGKRTCIMEMDIRKPKIASGLDLRKNIGITNYLVGNVNLDDIIIPVPEIENLFVVPCGPIPPNPAELLLDPKIDDLFSTLKERFDVLLVDSAPVGLVSDAVELGKHSSCTVFIVRQRYTLKKQVKLIDEFYKHKRLPQMSALMNDVNAKAGSYYGYNYGYSYGQGYGFGYYEDEKVNPGAMMYFRRLFRRR